MQDNRDDLYLNLRDAGVGEDVIGTQQDFKNFVTNEKNTRDLYKNLRDAGVGEDVIGTEDDFYNFVAPDFSGNKSSGTTKVGSAAQQVVNEYDQSAKDNAKAPEDLSAATAGAKIGGNISLTPAKPSNQQTAQPAVDNTAKSVMDASGTPVEQAKATGPKTQFVPADPNYVQATPTAESLKKYPWMQPDQVYLWNKTTKEPVVSYFDENGQAVTDEDLQIKKAKSEITGQEDTEYMHPEAAALQLPNGNTRGVRLKKGALTQMADEIMRKEYGDNYLNTQFGRDGNVYTGAERRDLGAQQLYDGLNSDVRKARISFAVADDKGRSEILSRIKAKWGKVADETSLVNAVSDENAAKEDIDIVAQQNINDLNAEIQNISRQMDQRGAEIDNASSPFVDQTFNARDVDAKYRLLQSKLNYAQNALKSWENVKNSGSLDALAGFKDAVMDISAWDFGFSDLKNAVSLLTAKGKDKQELVNLYGRSAEAAKFEDKYNPDSYRYGKIAGTSIPYALQFAGTDGGFKSIGSALSKKATSIAEKYALEGLKKQVVKGLGVAVGDIARAYTMSGTVQGLNTISDILTRSAGELTVDKQGNYQLKSDEPLLKSIYKGVTASAIQNFTEMVGESVNISTNLMRMLPKIGLGRVSNAITKIGTQDWYRVCNNWLSRAGVNDFSGEVLEEELSIILNAAFVGDNPLLNGSGGLLDVRTQKDILGGMLYSISAMRAGALAMYGVKKGVGSAFVKTLDMYDKMQLNQSDKGGQSIFGEGWTEIKDEIDNTPNDKVNSVIEKLAKEHPSKDEQSAIIDYAVKLLKTRGHNLGISMASDGENNEGAQEEIKDMPDLSQPNAEYINKDDGMIHKASLYPDASDPTGTAKDVFIIKGNLVTNEDGSINKDASDKTIIYIDGNGERHIASPDKFAAAYPPISNNEVQQANEGWGNEEAQTTGNYNKGDEVNINVDGNNYTATIQGTDGFGNYNVYYEDENGMMHPAKFTADQLNEMNGKSTVSNGQQATSEQSVGVQQQVEQPVVEQPAQQEQQEQPAQEEQKPAIPTDEKGNTLYHQVPVETTINDLYDGKLDDNEIRGFVDANINEADKQLEKINKKAPKIGTNKAEYLKKKQEWQKQVEDATRIRDYWNSVKDYIAKQTHTTSEEIKAAQDELSGEAARREYRGMAENIQQDPISVASDFIRGAKITPESFKAETGYGAEEQRKFVGMIAKAENGGKSIDRLAEELVSYDNAEMNGSLFGGDTSSAKDAILSALQGAGTRGELKQTNEAEEQAYVDARNAARDAQYMEQYGMTYEEYLAYEEQIMPTIWREYNNYDETAFNNMYAEEIEQLLKSRENDTTREEPTDDRGNQVLSEQQVNQQSGSEGSTEPGAEIQAGVSGTDENAVAPEETQQAVAQDESDDDTSGTKGNTTTLKYVVGNEEFERIAYAKKVDINNLNVRDKFIGPNGEIVEIKKNVGDGIYLAYSPEKGDFVIGNKFGMTYSELYNEHKKVYIPVDFNNLKKLQNDDSESDAISKKIATAEAETDTNPTEGQKEAGNYKKGHVRIDGYDITIEQPKGSVRRGTDANGKKWEQKMNNTYGYIRGTEGVDGDHIDIFLSDNPTEGNVYVVDQVNPDGSFDEHKVMYGFNSADEARAAYLSNYEEGWQGLGTITEVSKEEFKKWVNSSKRKIKPFSEYANIKKKPVENMSINYVASLPSGTIIVFEGTDFKVERFDKDNNILYAKDLSGDEVRFKKEYFNDIKVKYIPSPNVGNSVKNAIGAQNEDNTSQIQGLQGYSRDKIKNIVKDYVDQKLSDADADAKIKGVEIHGSRNRGDAREDSDLDVVIEYEGDIREDDMFNLLNDDEDALSIEDIRVDINPIREQETGTLDKYMERSRKYDEEKKNKEYIESISNKEKRVIVEGEDNKKLENSPEFERNRLRSESSWIAYINAKLRRQEPGILGWAKKELEKSKETLKAYKENKKKKSEGLLKAEAEEQGKVDAFEAAIKQIEERKKQIRRSAGELEIESQDGVRFREDDKSLIAVHNLDESSLSKALDLGGFPMPSIAVTNKEIGHNEYGDISLLFDKSSIDPSDRRNKVYGGDAWTPVFPEINLKINESVADKLRNKINDLLNGKEYVKDLGLHIDNSNLTDQINRSKSFREAYKNNDAMKIAFLTDKDISFKPGMQDATYSGKVDNATLKKIVQEVNKGKASDLVGLGYDETMAVEPIVRKIVSEYNINKVMDAIPEEKRKDSKVLNFLLRNANKPLSFADMNNLFYDAYKYEQQGDKKVVNSIKTREKLNKKFTKKLQGEYENWLDEISEGIVEKQGIRNERDLFTPSGNRRSWEQLYDEITLNNVVRAMQSQADKGGGFFGGNIFGVAQKDITSIDELRKLAKQRLADIDSEEYDKIKENISSRLSNISIPGADRGFGSRMDMLSNISDAVASSKNASGIYKYLKKYYPKVSKETANEIADIVKDIQNMVTRYFEAKPYRAVRFGEVKAAVIPRGTDKELVSRLESLGIDVRTYKKGDAESRKRAINLAAKKADILFRRQDVSDEYPVNARNQIEAEISSAVEELSSSLNTPIRVVRNLDDVKNSSARSAIEAGRNIKAWFDPNTKEVVVYMPNATDANDVKRSILHEVVGHKGLRELIGEERYDAEMQRLFDLLPDAEKKKVQEAADRKYKSSIAIAMDEYLAEQAELDKRPAWWQRIVSVVRDLLRKVGIDVELTDADVNYLLWKSKKKLSGKDAVSMLEDVARNESDELVSAVSYREITDKEKIKVLDEQPKIKVYRAMQLQDGKLLPPMSGKVKTTVKDKNGKDRTKWVWREPTNIGKWEEAEERPDLANNDGTFTLNKGNNSLNAAYNPYIHTSRSPINDQFSSAWDRDELVTVEVEIPESELTSGYHAEKAKDSVGEVEWKSGPVGRQLAKIGKPRLVILSRYDKPVRILSQNEVADEYAKRLEGTNIEVPFNTVSPSLRDALVAKGVKIGAPENNSAGKASLPAYNEWAKTREAVNNENNVLYREADTDEEINNIIDNAKADGTYMKAPNGKSTNLNERQWAQVRTKAFKDWFGDWENDPKNASKVVDENGEPKVVYHGTKLMNIYFKDGLPYTSRIDRFNEFKEGKGFFTPDKKAALSFANNSNYGLYEVFLNIRKPYIYDAEGRDWDDISSKEKYVITDDIVRDTDNKIYDSVYFKNVANENNGQINYNIDEFVVFRPNQIKSATDNTGAYSSEDDDIRYRFIGEIGARNLDAAEEATTRLDNLSVAREMENAYNEKKTRIEKLKDSKPVDVKYNGEYDLNRKPAKDWLKENVRGEYINNDTGEKIGISKVGINEVTSHGSQDKAHLKSLIAIPQMIEQSIFIDEIPNTKDHDKYDSYKYYVCGLKIDDVDYIVKLVVGVKGDNKYYDHRLTEIEKGTLIDNLNGLSNSVAENQNANISYGKDTKLQSILQTNDRENARKIKFATGWERGADGMWRYEAADFEYYPKGDARRNDSYKKSDWYNELHGLEEKLFNGETLTDEETRRFDELSARVNSIRDNDKNTERIYLDDYVKDDELFKAYPELKQTKIDFVDLPNEGYSAKYNEKENRITVNQAKSIDDKSAIAHEVQHAIQHIEGFAQGGNGTEIQQAIDQIESKISDILKSDEYKKAINDFGKEYNQKIDEEVENNYPDLEPERKQAIRMAMRDDALIEYKKKSPILQRLSNLESELNVLRYNPSYKSSYVYNNLSGEVEARNVEARINMTPEQRRQSLASETEDVAREDQLFIYDNLGVSARQGTGALTDSELSNANDPTGKMLGKPSRTPAQQRAFAARERQRMADHAREVADILHLDNVEIVTDASTLKGRRAKAKGFYSRDNGKIVIVVPNHVDMADIEQTVLHEAVAHYGLRKLFGSNFDTFLYNVYNNASKEVREKITQLAAKHNWDFATATEEYLASLAEKTNFEDMSASWWDKIKSLFLKLLHSIGLKGFTGVSLSDNELRYILWRSYENLKNPGRYRSIIDEARDMSMQNDLKVGNYSVQNSRNNVAEKSDNVLYREAKEVEDEINNDWRDEYDKKLSTFSFKLTEAAQDAMRSVKILQDIIAKETSAPISDDENVYWRENRLSSVNKYEQEYHSENYFKPIVTEIANLVKYGARYNDKGEDIINSDNDILKYLIAKHGIERNNYFREREAMNARKPYEDQIKELQKQVEKGEIKEEDANKKIAKLQEQADKAEMKKRVDVLHKDYSGLTELFQDKKDFDTLASSYVSDFEKRFDTEPLWNAINRATKGTLRKAFVDGLISRESYENTAKMYEYYIPLRGWANDVASEAYNYKGSGNSSRKILQTAKGRTSLADNPISEIGRMMQDAIFQGNRNRMKQSVYNLAMNHDTSLLNIKRQWYQNMGTKDDPIWERVFPDLSSDMTAEQVAEEVEDFESRMRELKKEGKATQNRKGLILRLHTTKREEAQHRISVAINGKEYNIFVNGNPRAAQAINGELNDVDRYGSAVAKVNRFLSQVYTSVNPEFVVTNYQRDAGFAASIVASTEPLSYQKEWAKNMTIYNPITTGVYLNSLIKKAKTGNINPNNKAERYMQEFLSNGGETGFTNMLSADDYKKQIKRDIKSINSVVSLPKAARAAVAFTERANTVFEDATRYATYVTSREQGRSIDRSIRDAKEISLNFNTRGADGLPGDGFIYRFFRGLRRWMIFVNPSIQGLNKAGMAFRNHPLRSSMMIAGLPTLLGYALPAIMQAVVGGGDGDDDDKNVVESYKDLPKWVRRTNIAIPIGGNNFVTIPLSYELRVSYGLGEMIWEYGEGMIDKDEIAVETLSQLSDLLPVSFSNGTVAQSISPSIARPLIDIIQNRNFYGKKIYNDSQFIEGYPEYMKAYAGTPKWLVKSTEVLNNVIPNLNAGVSDKYTPGVINVNPAIIDYLLSSYLGGLYNFPSKFGKTISMIWDEDMRDIQNVPILSRNWKNSQSGNPYNSGDRYKTYMKEYDLSKQRFNGYKKEAKNDVPEFLNSLKDLLNTPSGKRMLMIDAYKRGGLDKLNRRIRDIDAYDNERYEGEKDALTKKRDEVKEELINKLDSISDGTLDFVNGEWIRK